MVEPGGGDCGWTALLLALISINRGFYFSLNQGAFLAAERRMRKLHRGGPVRRQAPVLNQDSAQAVSTPNTDKKLAYNITAVTLTHRLDVNKGVIHCTYCRCEHLCLVLSAEFSLITLWSLASNALKHQTRMYVVVNRHLTLKRRPSLTCSFRFNIVYACKTAYYETLIHSELMHNSVAL